MHVGAPWGWGWVLSTPGHLAQAWDMVDLYRCSFSHSVIQQRALGANCGSCSMLGNGIWILEANKAQPYA